MSDSITPILHADRLYIGGAWSPAASNAKIDVRDSGNERVFLSVAEAQIEDVDRAVAAARTAFDTGPWPRMSPQERAPYLSKIADAWERRGADFSDNWTRESGVLHSLARSASASAGAFRYYAALADTFAWEDRRKTRDGSFGLLVREPVGVVGAIIPWNSPASITAYKVAPALIAGCTIVLKASPEAPSTAYLLAEICEEIGLPPGVLNILTADREVSERLVRHPDVDKISFTGSTAAGRRIASICGERIARCTLELGGKSPAVILDDYDLNTAAKAITQWAPYLSGQVCASLTRIIVSKHRHDELVEALSATYGKIKVGDPFDAASQMGPLAMERQRDRVESYIATARAEGAQLVTGGGRPKHLDRGYYIEPTIFARVDNACTIAREEVFGPVLSVIPADNETQAVEIANDTIYGLNASVFTNDTDKAYAVARQLRSGTVGHNGFKTEFQIGFGGFKQSGLGREGGVEGLMPYLETKTVLMDGIPSKFS